MTSLLIVGIPGLEDLLVEELALHGHADATITAPGMVVVQTTTMPGLVKLNLQLRQAYRVLILLCEASLDGAPNRDAIRDAAAPLPFSELMTSSQTFAVRGVRHGTHDFTSQNLAATVGTAVTDALKRATGTRVRANLSQPDVTFYAILRNQRLWIALDTTGEPDLNDRHPRPFRHFAPLRPALAAAMLRFGRYQTEHHLLDPMAGGGTLPVEAALMALQRSPDSFRQAPYAFEKLAFFEASTIVETLRAASAQNTRHEFSGSIRALDLFYKNLRGLKLNVEAAQLKQHIDVMRGNARILQVLEGQPPPDLVVTNPPFGLRIADPLEVRRLYKGFTRAAAARGIAELVVLTPQRQFLRNAFQAAGYHEREHRHIHYGKLETGLFRASLEESG